MLNNYDLIPLLKIYSFFQPLDDIIGIFFFIIWIEFAIVQHIHEI